MPNKAYVSDSNLITYADIDVRWGPAEAVQKQDEALLLCMDGVGRGGMDTHMPHGRRKHYSMGAQKSLTKFL